VDKVIGQSKGKTVRETRQIVIALCAGLHHCVLAEYISVLHLVMTTDSVCYVHDSVMHLVITVDLVLLI